MADNDTYGDTHGDTDDVRRVPSGIPIPQMRPGAPDSRGFSGPPVDACYAGFGTNTVLEPDGSVSTDAKAAPVYGSNGVDGVDWPAAIV